MLMLIVENAMKYQICAKNLVLNHSNLKHNFMRIQNHKVNDII